MVDFRRIRNDLLALALLAATLFVGFSLISYDPADPPATMVYPPPATVSNLCGHVGAKLAHGLQNTFGWGSWFLLLTMSVLDLRLFSRSEMSGQLRQLLGTLFSLVSLSIMLALILPGWGDGPAIGSGGYVGAWGTVLLQQNFSIAGSLILLIATFIAGSLIAADVSFLPLAFQGALLPWTGFRRIAKRKPRPKKAQPVKAAAPPKAPPESTDADDDDDNPEADESLGTAEDFGDSDESDSLETEVATAADDEDEPTRKPIKVNPPVTTPRSDRDQIIARLEQSSYQDDVDEYELPELNLLEDAEDFPYDLLAEKARVAAETLERTFQEFGLNVRVSEIDTGPVITQFELELEKGLRVSKVTALADDLAIALRVPAVRVVSPIPGKNTVGVEVPNEKQVMVRLRELIESSPDETAKHRIPLFAGKDVSGRPLVMDMTRMPHLLIAGRTGTGKSVCLNSIILSMLMTRSPEDVKMLMIDPKMVELSPYKRIPHLMHPVITDMKKAEAVLAWAVDKMEERYDLLARCGVRHLDGYNKLGKAKVLQKLDIDPDDPEQMLEAEAIPERMPYIVIIADEMADMMMTSGKDVEGHIIRLAQKSRAVGIHLVLATQKPTVDVITGLIKSNLPARISFQVASRTDSRVVLDEMGAERLLGNGDMLYLAPGTSSVTRAQGAYVSDEEVNKVIEFFDQYEPEYSTELAKISSSAAGGGGGGAERAHDDLYDEAVEVVIREQIGSVSRLQRFLGIGYGRAARLIDYMAEDGIVGDYNGSKAREVLYTLDQWEELKAGQSPADDDPD